MNQVTNKYRSFRQKAVSIQIVNSSNENAQQLKGKFTIFEWTSSIACFKQFLCSSRLAVWKATQRCVCFEFEFCVTGRRVRHHRHIAFLSVIEDAPLLTKTVKINQSKGIPGSGIQERTFVKNSYKRSRTSLPSAPLLFVTVFTSHRSPLSEGLKQARNLTIVCFFLFSFSLCLL